jgi:hypothetical protein
MPVLSLGQVLAVIVAMLSFTAGATAQLDPIVGHSQAVFISSLCSFAAGLLAVPLTILFSQSQQIKAVQNMPGIEKLVVNWQANTALATLATDPAQPKIEVLPSDKAAVDKTAKG